MNSNHSTRNAFTVLFGTVAVAFQMIGCFEKQTGNLPVDPPIVEPITIPRIPTALDSSEAYNLALWYSNTLTAPDSLVSEVFQALWKIRTAYGDSVRYEDTNRVLLNYRFTPSWIAGLIHIQVDDSTYASISNGTYTGWNTLQEAYRPTSARPWNYVNTVFVHFNPKFHPYRIAELYSSLPGVTFTEPRNCDYFEPEQIPLYPARTSVGWSFVFSRMRWSTYERTYFYFTLVGDSVSFFGSHRQYATPPPSWFNEAKPTCIDIWCSWSH